jgi:hypothetical protein
MHAFLPAVREDGWIRRGVEFWFDATEIPECSLTHLERAGDGFGWTAGLLAHDTIVTVCADSWDREG